MSHKKSDSVSSATSEEEIARKKRGGVDTNVALASDTWSDEESQAEMTQDKKKRKRDKRARQRRARKVRERKQKEVAAKTGDDVEAPAHIKPTVNVDATLIAEVRPSQLSKVEFAAGVEALSTAEADPSRPPSTTSNELSPLKQETNPVKLAPIFTSASSPEAYNKPASTPVPDMTACSLFTVSLIARKDNTKDVGLFASTAIKPGTRIMHEKPLIALPTPVDDLGRLWIAFEHLSPIDQDALFLLKPTAPLHIHDFSRLIDGFIKLYKELQSKGYAMTSREKQLFLRLEKRLKLMCAAWRVAARFQAYRWSLVTVPPSECTEMPAHVPVSGLFVTAGKIRHSCIPNCFTAFNSSSGLLTIHAVKPIAENEELTVSTIGNAIWYQSYDARAKLLRKAAPTFNRCECSVCAPASLEHAANFEKNERMRRKLHLNVAMLGTMLTTMDAVRNPYKYAGMTGQGGFPANIGAPDAITVLKIQDAEEQCLETIKLLSELGCADLEISRWRNALVSEFFLGRSSTGYDLMLTLIAA